MAKSMQVPVLVFEKHREVVLLMEALNTKKLDLKTGGEDKKECDILLHELYKIDKIYEKTNNS